MGPWQSVPLTPAKKGTGSGPSLFGVSGHLPFVCRLCTSPTAAQCERLSFPEEKIASRALQKSLRSRPCVLTSALASLRDRIPLAPHPCVRRRNTKEMPLKPLRLYLHSLRSGATPRARRPATKCRSQAAYPSIGQPWGVSKGGKNRNFPPLGLLSRRFLREESGAPGGPGPSGKKRISSIYSQCQIHKELFS